MLFSYACKAQTDSLASRSWSLHAQLTAIAQGHPAFRALYSGVNSLKNGAEPAAVSLTSTFFAAKRISPNGQVIADAELSGGSGISATRGMAGFPNGETYRIGSPIPTLYLARLYWQETFPLTHSAYHLVPDDVNQIGGLQADSRIVIIAGKFSNTDFFDNNSYSHDPRVQFLNWSLMSNGAWDYAANVRGYTYGVIAEWITPSWDFKISGVLEPREANGKKMITRILKSQGLTLEVGRRWNGTRPGGIRLLLFRNNTMAPGYAATLAQVSQGDSSNLPIISGNQNGVTYGGIKYGYAFNFEQNLSDHISGFFKTSRNDGKFASWAFTEIDQSVSSGLLLQAAFLHRKKDQIGLAEVFNGISRDHREFLKRGFDGFLLGDGNLNYGSESITELYYLARINRYLFITEDNQWVQNPGYNRDRGSVFLYGLRLHLQW